MGWKSTLFVLMSVFLSTTLNGQSCGENFYDSGGESGDYSNGEFETWTICPDNAGDLVTIDFTFVSVEGCCDDLSVYSGTAQDVVLNIDVEAPASFTSVSDDGCLVVTWSSDGSVVLPGWEAAITCEEAPACAAPLMAAVLPTSVGGVMSWTQVGDIALWDLEIGPAGFAATGSPTITGVTENPYSWTSGDSGQNYDYYVRASCGADGESEWIGPISFTTVPGCGDSFFDNGGAAGDYSNNELETWTFCPDNVGDLVTLDFTLVDVEGCCDDLSVYSGAGTDFLLEIDVETPTMFSSLSPDGCLTVTWDSDGSVVFAGWEATIGCIEAPACAAPVFLDVTPTSTGGFLSWLQIGGIALWDLEIGTAGFVPTGTPTIVGVSDNPYTWTGGESGMDYDYYVRASCGADGESEWVGPVTFTTVPQCGDNFYDSGGPDAPFENNENSTWVFCPDTPGDQVTLNFTSVIFANFGGDVLSVFNGNTVDGEVLNANLLEPEIFTSNTADGCLTVSFFSSGFTVADGWEATISCNPPPPCPNPSLIIIDNVTPVGADFMWTENGTANAWDVEIVEAGTDPTGTPTVSGVMDNSYTWEGGESGTVYHFYVRAQCGDGENSYWIGPFEFRTLPGCGDSFFDTGGENGEYENNELLTWTFCPDIEGEFVTLNFVYVDVEGCCDDLQVFDGTNAGTLLNGDLETPASFTSTDASGCLTVTFDSDGSVTNDGWEAIISCNPPPPCPNPSLLSVDNITDSGADLAWMENGDAIAWDIEVVLAGTDPTEIPTVTATTDNPYEWAGGESGTTYEFYVRAQCGFDDETSNWVGPFQFTTLPSCGDNFYDTGGVDGNYVALEDNTWTICPDVAGDIVVLDFTLVSISTFNDVLAVFNGDTTLQVMNADIEEPATFISTAANGCLTVTFTSGFFSSDIGWEATITCTPCPPVLAENVSIVDVNAFDAVVSWETAIMGGNYSIEYDTIGFTQGMGNVTIGNGTVGAISGLEENTEYEFYLSFFCADGSLSSMVGPYSFTTLFNNDLAITGLLNPSIECGLGLGEAIQIAITNEGSAPQTLFPINFSVNGVMAAVGQPQDGFYTGIVSNDSTEVFEFDLTYDFDVPGDYVIELWTDLEDDSDRLNDTFSIVITKYGIPFFEDFEGGVTPDYMVTTPDDFVTADHNNTSFVLSDNMFFAPDTLKAELPVLGPVGQNDTLFFDYRYTLWAPGTDGAQLAQSDTLMVRISDDCGETFETTYLLTGDNHEPTAEFNTVSVPLADYEGQNIKIQILAIYGTGDNWIDIDNINIPSCDNIALSANVVDASAHDANDGQVTLTPLGGIGPYEFMWNDGGTTAFRDDLEPGDYVVVLTDRFDCSTTLFVEVSAPVNTQNLPEVINSLKLMPNPTTGVAQIRVNFTEALDARIEVVNLLGQTVWRSGSQENVSTLDFTVDLTNEPAAMYLVRIHAADQVVTAKLLKTE